MARRPLLLLLLLLPTALHAGDYDADDDDTYPFTLPRAYYPAHVATRPHAETAVGADGVQARWRNPLGKAAFECTPRSRRADRAAAEAGDAHAATRVGVCLLNGGDAADEAAAGAWLARGAEGGDASAMTNLGVCRARGRCGLGPASGQAAREWHAKAADGGGSLDGMFNLGRLLDKGAPGLDPDPALALRWFGAAADLGHEQATWAAATMYAQGRGLAAPDYAEARKWLAASCADGNADAMYMLAVMEIKGSGAPAPDLEGGLVRLRAAARAGNGQAHDLLAGALLAG